MQMKKELQFREGLCNSFIIWFARKLNNMDSYVLDFTKYI